MLSKFDELRLIAQCVATDDRKAFGRLVEECQSDLRRFLLNLTLGDAPLTDDLAQETFLKAYLSIRSFKGLARFRTWLYRIAYNEYYSHMRRQKEVRQDLIDNPPDDVDVMSHDSIDARIDVESCMKRLSEIERTVVLLFYLEDLPIKKITEITSMPEGTIKSHLSRARVKMGQLLQS